MPLKTVEQILEKGLVVDLVLDMSLANKKRAILRNTTLFLSPAMYSLVTTAESPEELKFINRNIFVRTVTKSRRSSYGAKSW